MQNFSSGRQRLNWSFFATGDVSCRNGGQRIHFVRDAYTGLLSLGLYSACLDGCCCDPCPSSSIASGAKAVFSESRCFWALGVIALPALLFQCLLGHNPRVDVGLRAGITWFDGHCRPRGVFGRCCFGAIIFTGAERAGCEYAAVGRFAPGDSRIPLALCPRQCLIPKIGLGGLVDEPQMGENRFARGPAVPWAGRTINCLESVSADR